MKGYQNGTDLEEPVAQILAVHPEPPRPKPPRAKLNSGCTPGYSFRLHEAAVWTMYRCGYVFGSFGLKLSIFSTGYRKFLFGLKLRYHFRT